MDHSKTKFQILTNLKTPKSLIHVVFHPTNNKMVFTTASDMKIRVWNFRKKKMYKLLEQSGAIIQVISICLTGKVLVSSNIELG